MIGPGEVADITLASRASVVIVLPWAEGGHGNARDVRSWVKVEVDGIAQGAWVSRALATTRASWGRGENGPVGGGEAGPDVDDPGRSHAASGSADPPPAETSAGDVGRWVNDGLRRVEGPTGDQAGGDDDETVAECRAAAALLLRPWIRSDDGTGAIATIAGWIPAHVRHHLARGRGRPISWQGKLMTIAWMMEQCGIHALVGTNRQAALAHIEALGLLAAASRSLPFVGWATGRASATPGVNIPGMRHRNPLIFDTAGGHRGGDAERLLERVVKRIEGRSVGRRADGGSESDRGDPGRDDVNMSCGDTTADDGRGGDGSHAATASGGEGGVHDELPGAERGDERNGRADPDDAREYAADEGNPVPCGPPYSGTPTGDARSGELRADLQQGSGPPLGRKRGSSPGSEREAELRPVRKCVDSGPEWGARSDGGGGG